MDGSTETIITPAATRKAKAKRKASPRQPSPYAGLTPAACCDGCTAEGCVISAAPYCAHPKKGGLQNQSMGDMAAVKRFAEAKKKLAHAAVDRRG
jgi:hypothetical protein